MGTALRHLAAWLSRRLVGPLRAATRHGSDVADRAGRTPAVRAARRAARAGISRWRGSLRLRAVVITMLGSTVLVAAFGFVVAERITDGLLDAKRDAALKQVENARSAAYKQMSALTDEDDPSLPETVLNLADELANEAGQAGTFEVVLRTSRVIRMDPVSRPSDNPNAADYVPVRLGYVVSERAVKAYQFTRADPDGRGLRPYLVVGTQVQLHYGTLELYYLYPLDAEVRAASMIRTTVAITGVALVLLLSLIAWMVTRMVVNPVRMAARTAQRLSAGLLHERMTVRGEDELAKLASSFNQMAVNLQHQILQLEELSRLQRRFTSDVSHELRTPLTTVRMAADLLYAVRHDFPSDMARSAELLHDELDRFESLLSDLLEISRFDAGFAQLEAEPVDLMPVVRRSVEPLLPLAHTQGMRIEVAGPQEPVIAEVDSRRVERILRNLIGNAIDHGDGKPVLVTVGVDDTAVAVTVRDYGIGLRPGEEKLVFNRFWRADPSRARQTGGTGLGLSISLEDARLHGGWLEAWGVPGRGSQFRLTLPRRMDDQLVSSPLPLVPDDVKPLPTAVGGVG